MHCALCARDQWCLATHGRTYTPTEWIVQLFMNSGLAENHRAWPRRSFQSLPRGTAFGVVVFSILRSTHVRLAHVARKLVCNGLRLTSSRSVRGSTSHGSAARQQTTPPPRLVFFRLRRMRLLFIFSTLFYSIVCPSLSAPGLPSPFFLRLCKQVSGLLAMKAAIIALIALAFGLSVANAQQTGLLLSQV